MVLERNIIDASDYWHNLKVKYACAAEKVKLEMDALVESITARRSELVPVVDEFRYPIIDYPEFQKNRYINGRLIEAAIGLYNDKRMNLEEKGRCYRLLMLAKLQKKLHDLEKKLKKYEKISMMKFDEYKKIVRVFYGEVQRQLVLNGYGYLFEGKLGWICFNRVTVDKDIRRPIDFKATNERKAKLLAEGKRIYNKEEAEWCRLNNIEYHAEDVRVYRNDECWYEFCLNACRIAGVQRQHIQKICYRHVSLRGKTNDEIFEMTGGDKDKIMALPIDMSLKLLLCLKADKLLYTKFIRNENQTTSTYRENNRKD